MKSGWFGSLLILISIMVVGCRSGDDQPTLSDPGGSGDPAPESTNQAGTGLPASGVVSQWGISAEASSEFANPEWSASQAVGSPDAPGCGDYQFAWASAASDSIEILEVAFPRAVYPLEIQIHQSFTTEVVINIQVVANTGCCRIRILTNAFESSGSRGEVDIGIRIISGDNVIQPVAIDVTHMAGQTGLQLCIPGLCKITNDIFKK